MDKNYLQVPDAERTAWFTFGNIRKPALAAALFIKAAGSSHNPDKQCGGDDLCPISKNECDSAVQEFVSSFHKAGGR